MNCRARTLHAAYKILTRFRQLDEEMIDFKVEIYGDLTKSSAFDENWSDDLIWHLVSCIISNMNGGKRVLFTKSNARLK